MGFLSCGSFLCISFNKRLSIHKIKVYRHKSYLSSFLTFCCCSCCIMFMQTHLFNNEEYAFLLFFAGENFHHLN
jgi:hypothetical protein